MSELCTKSFSGSSDEIYYYPYAALGVVFVQNTTNVNINKAIDLLDHRIRVRSMEVQDYLWEHQIILMSADEL